MIQIYSINKLSQVKYHKIIPFYNQNHLDDVCFNQVGERQDLNYNIIETMLFQQNLGLNEIKKIIKNNDNKLYEYISTYGENISKNNVTLDQIEHLKRNYQVLINVLNEAGNQSINNFSLHFIITLSNGLIKNNRIDQAKQILKKCQVYVSSSHSDPILLITCLNNLANLHKMKGKRYKSLVSSLKALEIMQTHMNKLREKKQRQKLREDAVVFLIVIIRCKHTLSLILNKNENKQYRKAYDMMNYLGYRSCLKYLGKQSIFIKKFTPVERQLHLPVFKTEQKLEKRQQHQSEKLILQQLNKIHDVLKSKQNPDILVVNTNSALPQSKVVSINQSQQSLQIIKQIKEVKEVVVTQSEKSEKEIPRIPRKLSIKKQEKVVQPPIQTITQVSIEKKIEPKKEQEVAIVVEQQKEQAIKFEYVPSQSQDIQEQKPMIVEETIYVDKWQVKLIQQKERDQIWGKIMIESYRPSTNKKKSQNKKLQICEQKLQKIINQLNIEDKLPYQIFNQQLNQEFIEHYITPFLSIDKQGNPSISFKAKSLVQPFSFKIFNQQSLIFFNHVRNNLFRISISPYNSYKSIYLNVQFDFISMLRYFTFQQQVNDFFTAIFKSINKDSNVTTPTTIKDKNKTCKIINQYQMATYLKQIIAQFQNLLIHREDQTSMNQVLENELFYYKFKEINSNKQGTYYVVRYLPGINCFDIYLKNNYETYSIEGKAKARGNILYKSKQFLNDFGVPIKCSYSKKKLFSYIQIIVRKYTLMIFQKPLAQCQYDAYIENAILEFPICDNCFKTKTLLKQNYSTTLTISLLSINSQFPVGIKIIEYNPEQCLSRGFFIHIVPQQWLRPVRRAQPIINKVLFKAYIDQFDFRRDYFLPEWLQKKGFDKLFQRLLNPYHTLYLQNNINRFIRGKSLEGIFNKQDII